LRTTSRAGFGPLCRFFKEIAMTPADNSNKSAKNQGPADTSERPVDDVNDAQPYANRGTEDLSTEPGAPETSEGDRGDLSGRNLEQLEQAKGKP
jgi:hypothetical protein